MKEMMVKIEEIIIREIKLKITQWPCAFPILKCCLLELDQHFLHKKVFHFLTP